MSVSPTLALRLDPETIERLDDEAELRGHTRSSLARHLLRQAVGTEVGTSPAVDTGLRSAERGIQRHDVTATPNSSATTATRPRVRCG